MISVSPVPPVFPTRGTIGRRESTDSMATGCAKVLPILKRLIPTRHSTFNLSRRIQITEKTAVKIRFDVVNLFDKIYELR